jgi:hypothetical protein
MGVPEQRVRRSKAIAALPPETKARAAALGLNDNQVALLAAAKELTPEAQAAVLEAQAVARPA